MLLRDLVAHFKRVKPSPLSQFLASIHQATYSSYAHILSFPSIKQFCWLFFFLKHRISSSVNYLIRSHFWTELFWHWLSIGTVVECVVHCKAQWSRLEIVTTPSNTVQHISTSYCPALTPSPCPYALLFLLTPSFMPSRTHLFTSCRFSERTWQAVSSVQSAKGSVQISEVATPSSTSLFLSLATLHNAVIFHNLKQLNMEMFRELSIVSE